MLLLLGGDLGSKLDAAADDAANLGAAEISKSLVFEVGSGVGLASVSCKGTSLLVKWVVGKVLVVLESSEGRVVSVRGGVDGSTALPAADETGAEEISCGRVIG